jgi:tRNA A22 N-methylase
VLPGELISQLLSARSNRYARIVLDDQTQLANLRGWYNRVSAVVQHCYAELYRAACDGACHG